MKNFFYFIQMLFFFCLQLIHKTERTADKYMYNTLTINCLCWFKRGIKAALHTEHNGLVWMGPSDIFFYMHTPIERKKIGLGFNILNDQLGAL